MSIYALYKMRSFKQTFLVIEIFMVFVASGCRGAENYTSTFSYSGELRKGDLVRRHSNTGSLPVQRSLFVRGMPRCLRVSGSIEISNIFGEDLAMYYRISSVNSLGISTSPVRVDLKSNTYMTIPLWVGAGEGTGLVLPSHYRKSSSGYEETGSEVIRFYVHGLPVSQWSRSEENDPVLHFDVNLRCLSSSGNYSIKISQYRGRNRRALGVGTGLNWAQFPDEGYDYIGVKYVEGFYVLYWANKQGGVSPVRVLPLEDSSIRIVIPSLQFRLARGEQQKPGATYYHSLNAVEFAFNEDKRWWNVMEFNKPLHVNYERAFLDTFNWASHYLTPYVWYSKSKFLNARDVSGRDAKLDR